jgi:hypothetical protein
LLLFSVGVAAGVVLLVGAALAILLLSRRRKGKDSLILARPKFETLVFVQDVKPLFSLSRDEKAAIDSLEQVNIKGFTLSDWLVGLSTVRFKARNINAEAHRNLWFGVVDFCVYLDSRD